MVSNFFTDAVVVVVVLGFMIFIHELGHFMAAKWFSVRVLTFSLGFGKRLFGYKRGFSLGSLTDDEQGDQNHTDYRVSLLPFGGYVKMSGDDPSEERHGDLGEFLAKPRWQRFVIAVMGPCMNALLAVALLTGLYRFHFERPAYEEQQPARVGQVEPDSPAAQAGVLPGDLIVQLDGLQNPKWDDIDPKIVMNANEAIPVEVVRDGRKLHFTVSPVAKGRDQVGYVGWAPDSPPVVGAVEPGFPAGRAGLKPGDRIVAFNGKRSPDSGSIVRAIQAEKGKAIDFTVQRDGNEIHFQVQPIFGAATGDPLKKWRIGVGFREDVIVRQLPWGQALATSVEVNFRGVSETFDLLGKLLTRRVSARSISGPIGIAEVSGEFYRAGITYLLPVVAFISLQLAIFNLLPIPILDGGMIVLLLIEGALRRDLSLKVKERVAQVGMAFLLLLAAFVTYNDLIKTFHPY